MIQTPPKKSKLEGVIAIYSGDRVAYHEYDNQKQQMSAGRPLTNESIRRMFKFINKVDINQKYSFSDMIPKNVLRFEGDELSISWFTEPGTQMQYFRENGKALSDGVYPVPYLVWKLTHQGLWVMALNKAPKSFQDKVFQAPFMNVSSSGSVCMGSAKFIGPGSDYEKVMEFAMKNFYNSYFTHSKVSKLLDGNFPELMLDMQTKGKFDHKLLVKSSITIKDFIHGRGY